MKYVLRSVEYDYHNNKNNSSTDISKIDTAQNNNIASKISRRKNNTVCTCKRHKKSDTQNADNRSKARESFTEFGERIKILKKVKKIYVPNTYDVALGSSDTMFSNSNNKSIKRKLSSKCVGGIVSDREMNRKPTAITQTQSNLKKNETNYKKREESICNANKNKSGKIKFEKENKLHLLEIVGNKNDKCLSSDSLLENIYNFETQSFEDRSKTPIDPIENKLEREYRKMFSIKSKIKNEKPIQDLKSASLLRKRFEALRQGLGWVKEPVLNKTSSHISVPSHKDVSIASDPPSLEARSLSKIKIYSPNLSIIAPNKTEEQGDIINQNEVVKQGTPEVVIQDVNGMFKLWGKRFNLEDEGYEKVSSKILTENVSKIDNHLKNVNSPKDDLKEEKKKKNKRFSFFRKNKVKALFENKKVTAGRCEVGDGVVLKFGTDNEITNRKETVSKDESNILQKSWLKGFITNSVESQKNVKLRWDNKLFVASSSTVSETKDYNKMYKFNSGISYNAFHGASSKPKVTFVQEIKAWMMPKTILDNQNITANIKRQKSINAENVEVVYCNKKPLIKKSKAFAQSIKIVLHSKNMKSIEESSEYIIINIPEGYFSEGSDYQKQSTDEEVYNIVEYEAQKSRSCIAQGLVSRQIDADEQAFYNEENNLKIANQKPPSCRDVIVQGSKVLIPKRCDVIGVGIITQKDIRKIKKTIIKIKDNFTDDESEQIHPPQKKCEFAESYLQDYYKNCIPLGYELFSSCVSDSQLQIPSENISVTSLNNQENCTKSCPNIYDGYTIVSSCDTSLYCRPIQQGSDENLKKFEFFNKFLQKYKQMTEKPREERFMPKDSIEVCKKRKCANNNRSRWTDYDRFSCSIPNIQNINTKEESGENNSNCCVKINEIKQENMPCKEAKTSDNNIQNVCKAANAKKNPEGILTYKKSPGDTCKKLKLECPKKRLIKTDSQLCHTENPRPKKLKTTPCGTKKPLADLLCDDCCRQNSDIVLPKITRFNTVSEIPQPPCKDLCHVMKDPPCLDEKYEYPPQNMTHIKEKPFVSSLVKCNKTNTKNSTPSPCGTKMFAAEPVDSGCNQNTNIVTSFNPEPACKIPQPPCETPQPPCEIPQIPCETPKPPCNIPQPPCELPQPPCEFPKPPCETPKPPCETPKPPCETPKPPCETPKPPCDTPKPPCETPKQPCETPKPPCETPKPPCETPKPPCETPKPPCETPKSPCETPKPTCKISQPPREIPQPPCEIPQPPCETLQTPCETTQPPCETPQPPCETPQPPCNIPQPPCKDVKEISKVLPSSKKKCKDPPYLEKRSKEPQNKCQQTPKSSKRKCNKETSPCCSIDNTCSEFSCTNSPVKAGVCHTPEIKPSCQLCRSPKKRSQCPMCQNAISNSQSGYCECGSPKQCSPKQNNQIKCPMCQNTISNLPCGLCRCGSPILCTPNQNNQMCNPSNTYLKEFIETIKSVIKCSNVNKQTSLGCDSTGSNTSLSKKNIKKCEESVECLNTEPIVNKPTNQEYQTTCANKPKITGLHLKKKPLIKSCSSCELKSDVIKINSRENLSVMLRHRNPSTDEIRNGCNMQVLDKDGQILYERKDYRRTKEMENKNRSCIVKDMYRDPHVNRVSAANLVPDQQNLEINQTRSNSSVSNIIEINLTLKFNQGDKTANNSSYKDEQKLNAADLCAPKDVYLIQENQIQKETKDLDLKITIQNLKQDSNKELSNNSNYNTDFSKKISEKFNTVSTAYSDELLEQNAYSIRRANVNVVNSINKYVPSKVPIHNYEPINSKENVSISKVSSTSYSSYNKIKNDNNSSIMKQYSTLTNITLSNEEQNFLLSDRSKRVSETNDSIEGVGNNKLIDILKKLTREEKKEALKEIFEIVSSIKEKNKKKKIKKIQHLLHAVLTSDSSDNEDSTAISNKVEDIKYRSLHSTFYKDTKSFNNCCRLESSFLTNNFSKTDSKEQTYPTKINSDSESSNSYYHGCLCNRVAERLNIVENKIGCCCRNNGKIDKKLSCELGSQSIFVERETQDSHNTIKLKSVIMTNVSTMIQLQSDILNFPVVQPDFTSYSNHNSHEIDENVIYFSNDKILFFLSDSEDSRRDNSKYIYNKFNNPEDILQLNETKKAVLEIYSKKKVTNEGERVVAKLPKFISYKHSQVRAYENI